MSRRRLNPGEIGTISCTKQPTGKWRARVRYRGQDGLMHPTEVTADSKGRAIDLLRDKATELANTGAGDITLNSPMEELINAWWETEVDREVSGKISASTLAVYEITKNRIVAGMKGLRVREARANRLQGFVRKEGEGHPSVQTDLKRQLVSIFKHAMRLDLVDSNPAEVISIQTPPRQEIEAYSSDDVAELQKIVRTYEAASGTKGGRPRAIYLTDLVDLMLSTGCRISEMLGLRWEDVDLVGKTITVVGIVKTRKADPSKGLPYVYWQQKGKTPAAWRTIPLGEVALEILLRLHVNNDRGHQYVFATSAGTLRSPANVRSALRMACREAESSLPASRTHILRKTVATLVEESEGLRTASLLATPISACVAFSDVVVTPGNASTSPSGMSGYNRAAKGIRKASARTRASPSISRSFLRPSSKSAIAVRDTGCPSFSVRSARSCADRRNWVRRARSRAEKRETNCSDHSDMPSIVVTKRPISFLPLAIVA